MNLLLRSYFVKLTERGPDSECRFVLRIVIVRKREHLNCNCCDRIVAGRLVGMKKEDWITPEQVSQRTGLALDTLAHWRSERMHLPYHKIGRRVWYNGQDVDDYLRRCRVEPRKEYRHGL